MSEGEERMSGGGRQIGGREESVSTRLTRYTCLMQEASRNADELLKAEEKEKREAEKKKQKNKKVSCD